jgi:hypothetical protein
MEPNVDRRFNFLLFKPETSFFPSHGAVLSFKKESKFFQFFWVSGFIFSRGMIFS